MTPVRSELTKVGGVGLSTKPLALFKVVYGVKSSRERYTLYVIANTLVEADELATKYLSTEYPFKTFVDRDGLYFITTTELPLQKGVITVADLGYQI